MNAREFATASLQRGNLEGMGIQGYTIRKTCEMDKPRISVIMPYKKPTFLDEAIKLKRFVPDANYEVVKDMKDKNERSALPKGQRVLMSDEIAKSARRSPQPESCSYKPLYTLTEKRKLGAFNLKENR